MAVTRLAALALFTQAAIAGADSTVVQTWGDTQALDLNPYVESLRDEQGRWTIDDVSRPPLLARFAVNPGGRAIVAGFTKDAYWYRVTVAAPPVNDAFLEVAFPLLDHIDAYYLREDGSWNAVRTGDQVPFAERPVRHRKFMLPLRIAPANTATVYLRVQTSSTHHFSLTLWPRRALHEQDQAELLVRGIYYGIMLAMILYNVLLFAGVRDPAYRDYVPFILFAGVLVTACFDGLGQQFLWGAWPSWSNRGIPWFASLAMYFGASFAQKYLQTKARVPRLDRVMTGMRIAALVLFALAFVLDVLALSAVTIGWILFSTLVQFSVIHKVFSLGYREGRTGLLAFTPVAIGVPIQTLAFNDIVFPANVFTTNAGLIGFAMAVILLSLALADRINSERRERERLSRLKRFFAPQVAQTILGEGGEAQLAPARRDVTVMFTDLRGFTAFSAKNEPDEVMRVLREYHEVVGRIVTEHQATLEHFAGDGVMIFFNAPLEVNDPEMRAVRMSFDLRIRFEQLRQDWNGRGYDLGVGIGMDCGLATVGAVGSSERWGYAAIGPVSNLASRLCGLARHGQILVSSRLHERLAGRVEAESLGQQEIKGLPGPVTVYSLLRPVSA